MRNLVFIALSFLVFAGCSQAPNSVATSDEMKGIRGGSFATPSDPLARSVVLIFNLSLSTGTFTPLCTGVVIAKNLVLTAGHCIREGNNVDQKMSSDNARLVYFGSAFDFTTKVKPNLNHLSGSSKLRFGTVDTIKVQPKYIGDRLDENGIRENDLALIKLNSAVPAGTKIATLPPAAFSLPNNTQISIYGFGPTQEDYSSQAVFLRQLGTTLQSVDRAAGTIVFNTTEEAGVIPGDSGGPAFAEVQGKTVILGIAHSAANGRDGKYTLVNQYISWIHQAAKELGATL